MKGHIKVLIAAISNGRSAGFFGKRLAWPMRAGRTNPQSDPGTLRPAIRGCVTSGRIARRPTGSDR